MIIESGTPRRAPFQSSITTRVLRRFSLAVLLGVLLSASGPAQSVSEYQMKAAYVYNLAKFVEWPAEVFKAASDPLTICVLGQSPILVTLNEAVNGELIDEKKLLVRQVSEVQQAGNCHILFIASSDRKYLHDVPSRSEDARGSDRGGIRGLC